MNRTLHPATMAPSTHRTGSRQPTATAGSGAPSSRPSRVPIALPIPVPSSSTSSSGVTVTAEILPRTQPPRSASAAIGSGETGLYTGRLHGTLQQAPPRRRGPQAQVARVDRPGRRGLRARDGGALRRRAPRPHRQRCARQLDQIDDDDKKQEHLDDLLPEAFAAVREAGKRTLGQRHFDVQIMGGAALHFGWVAEMKTGEGKTLVATLPRLPQRAVRRRRPPRHRQRLPGQARRRVDGPALPLPRPRGRRGHPRDRRPRGEAAAPTPPTSPTAPTTSSASTTSRQHGRLARRPDAARPLLRDRRRGRLDPHRRGPHAAHHLRAAPTTRRSSTTSSRRS